MPITLEQYIQNPMGKKSAVLSATARQAITNGYKKKFDAILLREHSNINYNLYEDKKNNIYVAHIKVPSEVVPKFYYDTVLEFSATEDTKNTENLLTYNVRFYSNDPAFSYNYGHAMIEEGLFIDYLRPKISSKVVKKEAVERNPRGEIGYVKSLYFAYLTMKLKNLTNRTKFSAEARKFSKTHLLETIEPADKKISERQTEGEKIAKKKSAEKQREKKQVIGKPKTELPKSPIGTTKRITAKSGGMKTIGTTKKVKRK